jgi:Taurine catabolism dioxygenase TauD, TfdA family/Gamma-butyrobetaine hydroxylase-like, N-terminal
MDRQLHPLALRDACTCASCQHPVSGHRLFETRDVVPGARVESVAVSGNTLAIDSADGHRSTFARGWLEPEIEAGGRGARPLREFKLWGSELAETLPAAAYRDVLKRGAALRRLLAAVAEYGFALLSGAPVEDGAVATVAELFGRVRATNYGRVFDVSVRVDATNLADTAMALSPHTDNPYRVPVPTLQLLHCLSSSVSGGETILVDGFRAALLLAERSPEHLSELARRRIRFAYLDATAELSADVPGSSSTPPASPRRCTSTTARRGFPPGDPRRSGPGTGPTLRFSRSSAIGQPRWSSGSNPETSSCSTISASSMGERLSRARELAACSGATPIVTGCSARWPCSSGPRRRRRPSDLSR